MNKARRNTSQIQQLSLQSHYTAIRFHQQWIRLKSYVNSNAFWKVFWLSALKKTPWSVQTREAAWAFCEQLLVELQRRLHWLTSLLLKYLWYYSCDINKNKQQKKKTGSWAGDELPQHSNVIHHRYLYSHCSHQYTNTNICICLWSNRYCCLGRNCKEHGKILKDTRTYRSFSSYYKIATQ